MTDPFLDSLAAALGGQVAKALGSAGSKALEKVRELVRRRSEDDPETAAALEAAEQPSAGRPEAEALAQRLEEAGAEDPDFAERLRSEGAEVHQEISASGDGVTNVINGSAKNVVQAREVNGGITFN